MSNKFSFDKQEERTHGDVTRVLTPTTANIVDSSLFKQQTSLQLRGSASDLLHTFYNIRRKHTPRSELNTVFNSGSDLTNSVYLIFLDQISVTVSHDNHFRLMLFVRKMKCCRWYTA